MRIFCAPAQQKSWWPQKTGQNSKHKKTKQIKKWKKKEGNKKDFLNMCINKWYNEAEIFSKMFCFRQKKKQIYHFAKKLNKWNHWRIYLEVLVFFFIVGHRDFENVNLVSHNIDQYSRICRSVKIWSTVDFFRLKTTLVQTNYVIQHGSDVLHINLKCDT